MTKLFFVVLIFLTPSVSFANCDIRKYVFQDQDGAEAVVKEIRECFGWFNRDRPSQSSGKGICYTEREANEAISSQSRKYNVRIVGSRILTVLYKNKFLNIAETAIVGSPWLSYEVDPDLRNTNLPAYKPAERFYELLGGGDVRFDFTTGAPAGFDTPEHLYKALLGKQFIFKRCEDVGVPISGDAKADTSPSVKEMRKFLQLNGTCVIERKAEGQKEDCDNMVMHVIFEDGYLSFQFHSKDKDKTGRYNWVVDLVGPGVTEVPEHGGTLFYMAADKLNIMGVDKNNQIREEKYHDMGCLLTFADARNLTSINITKLTCWYGENPDKATMLYFSNIKAGQGGILK